MSSRCFGPFASTGISSSYASEGSTVFLMKPVSLIKESYYEFGSTNY